MPGVSKCLTRAERLIDVFDTLGRVVPEGGDDSENSSLVYVAKRA